MMGMPAQFRIPQVRGGGRMLPDNEITVDQAAAMLDTTPQEVERLIKRSLLPCRMHITPNGQRYRLIDRDVCRRLVDSGYMQNLHREDTPTPPQRADKEVVRASELTTENWSSSTHVIAEDEGSNEEALPAVRSPAPEAPLAGDIEERLLTVVKEVAGVAARVGVIEGRFEVTRQLERDLSTLSERLRHHEETLKALSARIGAVESTEEQHSDQLKRDLHATIGETEHLQEAIAVINHQTNPLYDLLSALDERLRVLEEWVKESENKRPLAQVKKFIAERKGKEDA